MRKTDQSLEDIGAEALPGGLREINAISRPGYVESAPCAKPPRHAPLVGLIELVTSWLGRAGNGP
ncbi:MAG: hypothetical protein OEV81_09900 [Betaproteobacteria bacterium]|nr:hypothetical protein [Betaproteobacteria bacterium]MDH5220431.1 hypothetical protein [Betaproteobacteria bacterium]MDH5349522.1 hypothetical protein [Betaproteobacteria bacterium]